MTDLFLVCWTMLATGGLSCTGILPTPQEAVRVATYDYHAGLARPCISRVVYTDRLIAFDFPRCWND